MKKGILLSFLIGLYSCGNVALADKPDYIVESIQTPGALAVGDTGALSFSIKNKGIDGSASCVVKLYISAYFYHDSSAILLDSLNTGRKLKSGEKYPGVLNYTLPVTSPAEGYFLVVIENSDEEMSKYNNIASTSVFTVTGGVVTRTEIAVDNLFHEYTINSLDTQNYSFAVTTGHAYQIYWDDFYDGAIFIDTGADVFAGAQSQDGLTNYFTSQDSGYSTPGVVSASYTGQVYLDFTASGWAGSYSVRIRDMGVPPDMSISIDSAVYSAPAKTLTITFTLTNTSAVANDGSCFSVGLFENAVTPPVANDAADLYVNVCRVIAGGGTFTDVATLSVVNNNGTSFAYADIYNGLIEGNETNNASAGVAW